MKGVHIMELKERNKIQFCLHTLCTFIYMDYYCILIRLITCIQCGFKAYYRQDFIMHIPTRIEVHENRCVQCDEVMKTHNEYLEHIDEKHDGKFKHKCIKCHELFDSKKEVKGHLLSFAHSNRKKSDRVPRISGPENKKICPICGMKANDLYEHNQAYHVHEEVICSKCGKKFQNKSRLKRHNRFAHNTIPCEKCGKLIPKSNAKEHYLLKHTPKEDLAHKCKECGKGFIHAYRLTEHMIIHSGEKPYKCQYCQVGFASKSNKDIHEKSVHFGIKRAPRKR